MRSVSSVDWEKREITYSAVFIRSVGATATTLSTHPAAMLVKMPGAGLSFPCSSDKIRNLTLALKAVPNEMLKLPVHDANFENNNLL